MFRTTSTHATKTLIGASPMSLHQPLETLLVAGSLMVALARSAADRLA